MARKALARWLGAELGAALPINADFEVGGERLFLPSDPKGSLAETAGCRCVVDYMEGARSPGSRRRETDDGTPIRRGNKAVLTDMEIANIVFNETASFYGPGIDEARKAVAHVVINGDERLGTARPGTARIQIRRPLGVAIGRDGTRIDEAGVLVNIRQDIVPKVREERRQGHDAAGGNLFFGFRDAHNLKDFPNGVSDVREKPRPVRNKEGKVVATQPVYKVFGPFMNSAPDPSQGLGGEGIYIVIFKGREK